VPDPSPAFAPRGRYRDPRFCMRLAILRFLILSLRKNTLLVGVALCIADLVVFRSAISKEHEGACAQERGGGVVPRG
jgi:hypothetical protein